MNTTEEDSPGLVPVGDVSMDGNDPDAPPRRINANDWHQCVQAVKDWGELKQMSEADVRRYCGQNPHRRRSK